MNLSLLTFWDLPDFEHRSMLTFALAFVDFQVQRSHSSETEQEGWLPPPYFLLPKLVIEAFWKDENDFFSKKYSSYFLIFPNLKMLFFM